MKGVRSRESGARRLAGLLLLAPLLFAAGDPDGKRWWSYVAFLADDKLEGRNTGSEGHRQAARYVAGEFESAGLQPAGVNGYMQPVRFLTRQIVEEKSSLALVRNGKPEPLKLGEDANLSTRTDLAAHIDAPLVFVGYGLTVPELNYHDLAGLDLKDKVAVSISGGPNSIPPALRAHAPSAGERWKHLKAAGAIGVAFIQNPKAMDIPWARATLARFQPSMDLADQALRETEGQKFALMINPAHAEKFFAGSGHTFAELLKLVDSGQRLPGFPLPASVRATAELKRGEVESQNIAGVLPGSDPKLKNEYVVLSAHVDHVGVGLPVDGDRIYNGAMDDASGVASLIELARELKESGTKPKRSLLFLAVTGEEKGLQGSKYFAAYPTVPAGSIVADINLDMYLPLHPLKILNVYGLEESDLGDQIRAAARDQGVEVQGDPEPQRNVFIRSDQYSFIRRGVPSLSFKFGYLKGSPEEQLHKEWLKKRYHAPSDDVNQPVDRPAAARFNRLMLALAERVADAPARPQWKKESFFRRYAAGGSL